MGSRNSPLVSLIQKQAIETKIKYGVGRCVSLKIKQEAGVKPVFPSIFPNVCCY